MTAGTGTVGKESAPTGADTAPRAGSTRGRLVLKGIHKALGGKEVVRAHDDLYARDLLRACVQALDERPDVILA
ncbi:hypothetical protein ACWEWX_14645, partial [Streptomyces asiaticus]